MFFQLKNSDGPRTLLFRVHFHCVSSATVFKKFQRTVRGTTV